MQRARWYRPIALGLMIASAGGLGGCGSVRVVTKTVTVTANSTQSGTQPKEHSASAAPFTKGVLITKDVKVVITSHRVIPPGGPGNDENRTLIAFECQITNISGKKTSPVLETAFDFSAEQDNNPNRENKLEVGPLPDDRFLATQDDDIKKGGTVGYAFSYELTDLKTPVRLEASSDGGISTLGTTVYPVT